MQRRAARVRADRVLDLADRAVEHVGHDPAPQSRLRATADEVAATGNGLPGELLDASEQPAAVERDALEHRAHEIGARSVCSERSCQPAAEAVVVDGRALAVQPGREDHAVAPGGALAATSSSGDRSRRARPSAERVVGKITLSRSQFEARARHLLLVGDVVLARQRRRQRRDAVEEVGLLERDVAREPRRRADVEVALEVADRARADGRRLQVGRPADHGNARPGRRARAAAASVQRPERPTSRARGREAAARSTPNDAQQAGVVVDAREVAVVGDPVQHDRVVGRRARGR